MHLFYKNDKRVRHNLECINRMSTEENPTAFIQTKFSGGPTGLGVSRHFSTDAPATALLAVGAKVALEKRNFCPVWGLHNGACGVIQELVFAKGQSPNNGDIPRYAVVDFPLYKGPVWDKANPTVRNCFASDLSRYFSKPILLVCSHSNSLV